MKQTVFVFAAVLCVLLAGCGQTVEWANPEDYQDRPYQELSLGELADPERIVLAKNGREKSAFETGSDEYEHLTTMIRSLIDTELDKNEQIEELGRKLDQTMFYMLFLNLQHVHYYILYNNNFHQIP